VPSNHPAAIVRRYMVRALEDLPEMYADALSNVEFVISRAPMPRDRRRMGLRGTVYGLYEGIPLTRRGEGYGGVVPDKITLYWGPLYRDFLDDGALADEVRNTVLHEIGHFFGLEEQDLHDTRVE